MPAAIPILIAATAVSAGTAVYGAVQQNQQVQHAKGAAQAQETAMNNQLTLANQKDEQTKTAKASQGSSTQASALAAIKAAMSASSGFGGTLLTSGTGTQAAPTATKTLLGA